MDQFLASVERRAYGIAKMAVGHREEALDIVQDAMLKLVQLYADKPQQEWRCLFFKILQSRIRDWYRRNKVRNRWRVLVKTIMKTLWPDLPIRRRRSLASVSVMSVVCRN